MGYNFGIPEKQLKPLGWYIDHPYEEDQPTTSNQPQSAQPAATQPAVQTPQPAQPVKPVPVAPASAPAPAQTAPAPAPQEKPQPRPQPQQKTVVDQVTEFIARYLQCTEHERNTLAL